MKTNCLFFSIVTCLFISSYTFSQSIKVGFNEASIEVKRAKKDLILPLKLFIEIKDLKKDSLDSYKLDIKVNSQETNIISSGYQLYFEKSKLSSLENEKEFFLKIIKDTIPDRQRKLVFEIELSKKDSILKKTNEAKHKKIEIILNSYEETLDGYKYLAYVGTNFDLVEGIRAKDLFFATNVYSQPKAGKNKNVGFYLSIYGNRAFTQTDSAGTVRREIKFESLTDTTSLRTSKTDFYTNKRVTDNIGVYISPLIKLKWFKSNNPERNINLYYSPSLEFVYRRSTLSFENLNIGTTDSLTINRNFQEIVDERLQNGENTNNPVRPLFTKTFNEYSFNLGIIGVFLSLENEKISVRAHGSIGYASNYNRDIQSGLLSSTIRQQSDIFFSGRAWVTDSKTGITLQAEVTNTAFNHRPFFVATLSKAFNFKKIGDFFQPIVKQ
ncbi:hypothetical protein [Flavivirga jejuensis]|uniref:Uncharacterized protein n=1 Tax=Flavivirga jejuensis TaxID=870487 RepID=A0ABT8WSW7_9FLAO|nr:hypothetical protein [Flavivirga jejuensis]MDO5976090.1 hypothetical protein [Flavivirga jejuensis]